MRTQKTMKDASSRPGARNPRKDDAIGKASRARRAATNTSARTNWGKLRSRSDASIRQGIASDPEAHATDAAFWKHAKIILPTPKTIVTMRLDADLLQWFRQHPGYQTRINAILRAYMQANKSA
ncbi:MAG: BrnA antitoxin family protein [Candidatus Sulfotelmatobacter sp.]